MSIYNKYCVFPQIDILLKKIYLHKINEKEIPKGTSKYE